MGWPNGIARREVRRRRVTLEADGVHTGAIEQPWIWSAVRDMACDAAFGFDDWMLIGKRPAFFRVALGADQVHLRRGPEVLLAKCSVGIVAVGALDKPFLHFVMEGHVELRLCVGVALEAEFRLRDLEQLFLVFAAMNAVAAYAAHVVLAVRGALEVGVLALMATQAPGIHFLRCRLGGIKDLGDVATTVDVCLARSMAAFAGRAGFAVHLCELSVLVRAESFGDFFVTGGANLLANEVSRCRRRLACFGTCRMRSFCRSSNCARSERN